MLAAAGLLVFRRVRNEIQYLLLQASYGEHHWSPPKGHLDEGETELEAALRETREEAGLKAKHLKVDSNFRRRLNYVAHGKDKCVTYWVAELVHPDTPVKLSREHQDFKWLPLEAAGKLVGFPDLQHLLYEADKFIRIELS